MAALLPVGKIVYVCDDVIADPVGVVGLRARAQCADAGAQQPERGAVDLLHQHFSCDGENFGRELRWAVNGLRTGSLPEIGRLQFQSDCRAGETALFQP